MVYRTARVGLRLTRAQRHRCLGLLRSAGDVRACVLELNAWRRQRRDTQRPRCCRAWSRTVERDGTFPVRTVPA